MADVYLWLSCGQSNNQGKPPNPDSLNPKPEAKPAPTNQYPSLALEWEEGKGLVALADNRPWSNWPIDYRALRGSAWPAFFNAWVQATQTKNVLVRCAQGGSSVLMANSNGSNGDWSAEQTDPNLARFQASVDRANAAIAAIAAAGDVVVAVNVLWHGGEGDAAGGNELEKFKDEFKALLPRWRTALNRPNLKMYVARVGRPEWSAYSQTSRQQIDLAKIRDWQTEACNEVDGMELAYELCILFPKADSTNPQGLNWMNSEDGIHYAQDGYNDMGFGMAAFIANDMNLSDPIPPPPEFDTSLVGHRLRMAVI